MIKYLQENWLYMLIGLIIGLAIILIISLTNTTRKNSNKISDLSNENENKRISKNKDKTLENMEDKDESLKTLSINPKVSKAEEKTLNNDKKIENVENSVISKNPVSKYIVIYDKIQSNWVVKKTGAQRASKRCTTKEEALKVAKNLASKNSVNLTVHKKNGQFQKKSNAR